MKVKRNKDTFLMKLYNGMECSITPTAPKVYEIDFPGQAFDRKERDETFDRYEGEISRAIDQIIDKFAC